MDLKLKAECVSWGLRLGQVESRVPQAQPLAEMEPRNTMVPTVKEKKKSKVGGNSEPVLTSFLGGKRLEAWRGSQEREG